MQPFYSAILVDWVSVWESLILCRGAASVFCSFSPLGHSLRESYPLQKCREYILQLQSTGPLFGGVVIPSVDMQPVYSAAQADWASKLNKEKDLRMDKLNL